MHGSSYPYTRQPEDGDGASPRLSVGGTSAKELDREGKEIMGFRYRFNEESATRESEPTPRYVRSVHRGPREQKVWCSTPWGGFRWLDEETKEKDPRIEVPTGRKA